MLNFEKDFPEVKKVFLSVNYRSQAAIVRGAGCVIKNNRQRFDKQIRAARPEEEPIDIRVFQSPADENAAVIREIRDYHGQGIPYHEMAVLFRTNTQARMLLEKMMEYNIPFKMQDAMPNIYQHWVTQDMMAYIQIALGDDMGKAGLSYKEDITISSMCTVFAESEVVSLIAQNKATDDIVHGLNKAFLGSGMTTFLKQYAKYLMAQGKNIGILENDFGAVNVDMLLLQELRGDQCELEMISGGCDKETHRRRFRTKLISMGMSGYDRILVEPSGIYDVDEFFDTLYDEPLNRWYEAGSVITILDAGLDEKLSEEEEYLLASEAANAGKIVLSKVQNVSEEKKEETIAHLNRTLEQAGSRRQFSNAEILQKNWDDLTEDDFKMLSECSYRSEDYRKLDFGEQQTFDSLCFLEPKITEEALKKAAEAIFADPSCGNVFRIKGIVKTGETVWSEINATREQMTFQAVPESQEVLIVIGAGLSKERISGILGIE